MKLTLTCFGITKDIIGKTRLKYRLPGEADVAALKQALQQDYPELARLASLVIAVNGVYRDEHQPIFEGDEVVLIPPVSGG